MIKTNQRNRTGAQQSAQNQSADWSVERMVALSQHKGHQVVQRKEHPHNLPQCREGNVKQP